jgi:hypothetical protein
MDKKISNHKKILHDILVAQNVQTLHNINAEIQPHVLAVGNIQPVYTIFNTDVVALDEFVKNNPKAFETDDLIKKDKKRDSKVRAIIAKAQYHYDFAQTEEEKEVARQLLYIVGKYKGVERKSYESETAYLRRMVTELQEVPDLLKRFDVTDLVDGLKQENEEFEALYNARTQILHSKQIKGNATKYRTKANKSFDDLCNVITASMLMPISEAEKAALEAIVDIINAHLQQATITHSRHAGVVASKKKKEELAAQKLENEKKEGQVDENTTGQADKSTTGQVDKSTTGQVDAGTNKQVDAGTSGQTDAGTSGQVDKGTSGQGEKV